MGRERRGVRAAAPRVLKGGPSKLRGVIWHKSNGKWEARIYEAGKQRFLGYYTSEIAAAKAYDARAVQLHGAAAKVNFPEEHEETRNNPPAEKPCYALVIAATLTVSLDQLKHKYPRGSSWTSANTRLLKRKDSSCDEDYIQPMRCIDRSQAAPQYSLRPGSIQRRLRLRQPLTDDKPAPGAADLDAEDEQSLEQGAVEVLATLLSSSSEDAASRRSSHLNQISAGLDDQPESLEGMDNPCIKRQCSPPTSSTGASPAIPLKTREWTMPSVPSLWVHSNQESPAPAESSCHLSGQAFEAPPAKGLLGALGCEESCADSLRADRKKLQPSSSNEGSCSETEEILVSPPARPLQLAQSGRYKGVSWNAVCRKWVAVIWDRQAKRARHIGTFDNDVDAAHAYDRVAATMVQQSVTLKVSEDQQNLSPASSLPAARFLSPNRIFLPPRSGEGSQERQFLGTRQLQGTVVGQVKITTAARAAAVSSGKSSRGSSRFRGVSWCEKGQKWRALLWDGSRQHFLGHFKTEEEGARAYDRALLIRKKKDGCLNFPLADYQDITGAPEESDAHTFLKPGQANAVSLFHGPVRVPQPVAAVIQEQQLEESRTLHNGRTRRPPQHLGIYEQEQAAADSAAGQDESEDEEEGPGCGSEQRPGDVADATPSPKTGEAAGLMRSRTAHGSSRFKGVSWSARSGKWRSQMWLGAKVLHLGFFDDELAAARAYDEAVASHRGPDAPANFTSVGGGEDLDKGASLLPHPEPRAASTFRGVRWHERNSKWEARIFDGQRQISLGYFDGEVQAAMAFDAAAVKLRGPSTCTNFVPTSAAKKPNAASGKVESEGATPQKRKDFPEAESLLGSGWGQKRRRN